MLHILVAFISGAQDVFPLLQSDKLIIFETNQKHFFLSRGTYGHDIWPLDNFFYFTVRMNLYITIYNLYSFYSPFSTYCNYPSLSSFFFTLTTRKPIKIEFRVSFLRVFATWHATLTRTFNNYFHFEKVRNLTMTFDNIFVYFLWTQNRVYFPHQMAPGEIRT